MGFRPVHPYIRTCLVGQRRRFVYAYVPKAACTSLKLWMAMVEGMLPVRSESSGADGIHALVTSKAMLESSHAGAILNDPRWFKFAFVRNPLSRLVSAYLDKVVPAKSTAARLVRNFQIQDPSADWWQRIAAAVRANAHRGLTFRELVRQLGRERLEKVDEHFRPQSLLLAGLPLDFIGHVEQMRDDFDFVQRRLGTNVPLPHEKKQHYAPQMTGELVADWPVEEFRKQAAHPHWRRFYPPEVLAAVAHIYRHDFANYGYRADLEPLGIQSVRRAA